MCNGIPLCRWYPAQHYSFRCTMLGIIRILLLACGASAASLPNVLFLLIDDLVRPDQMPNCNRAPMDAQRVIGDIYARKLRCTIMVDPLTLAGMG